MPKKKCRFLLVLQLFCVLILAINAGNIAMFSDSLVIDYRSIIYNQSYYIDSLLLNTSIIDRYESNKYCLLSTVSSTLSSTPSTATTTSLVKNLIQYSNYTKNTFETNKVFIPCELIVELFCNLNTTLKYIFTHSVFDCGDLLNPDQITNDYLQDDGSSDISSVNTNIMKIIYLSPTVLQIEIALKSFMSLYSLNHYGIIYSNSFLANSTSTSSIREINYYQMLAYQLVYQLSADLSFNLDFSVQLYDSSLPSLLSSSIKIIFLILRCGEEVVFMSLYSTLINTYNINLIAIYDSPQCVSIANFAPTNLNSTQKSAYSYLYKLVPVDLQNDANAYSLKLQSIINPLTNLQSNYLFEVSNALDELENAYLALNYNSLSNTTYLKDLNETVTLKCFKNPAYINTNLTFKFCYRQLKFVLFGYNNSIYSQVGYITLPDILSTGDTYNATVVMYGNYTFQQPTTTTTSTVKNDEIFKDVLFAVIAMVIFAVLVCILAYIARSRLMRKELSKGPNKILLLPEDLDFVSATSSTLMSRPNVRENDQNKSQGSLKSDPEPTTTVNSSLTKIAKYKGDIVIVKYLKIPNFQMKNSTMREFRMLRDLRHENLNAFLGCYIDLKSPALIFDYATRGSLQDIVLKKDIKLDWNFKWSMLNDLCRGMRYLHHSQLKYHGNLKSRNCVVDSRWVLKVTDFGLPNMYSNQNYSRTLNLSDLLWTAPEHLRQTTIRDQVVLSIGSQAGDIYSFSIIMQELIVRGTPFCMLGLTEEEIISKIRKPPPLLRPSVSKTAAPPEYVNIMRDCWSEQPELRPTFDQLYSMFKSLNGDKKVNIVDLMFKMIEQYTNNLEDLVKEKTLKFEEEKKKTEKLLCEMLPKTVAESLMAGGTVPPESFDMVTIYFSDIVGFTTISAYSSPFEVVQLLNDLYTMFDDICDDHDVYKVETIGDAYMVVSGLPIRNGNKHAGEIATMALNLLHHCGQFKINHLPGIPLRLRIGIHSGACVSGVVGSKMPRYCLFGDTVNTASRMESTSQAYRIHVSQSAATILEEIGGYKLEFRGETELKGKGKHKTYWLVGKEGFDKELPDPVTSENNHGIDAELIQTIEKIKAEQKLKKKDEKENVIINPSIFKELTSLETSRKKSKQDEGEDGDEHQKKLSESFKTTSSLAFDSKSKRSAGPLKSVPPNKNDSGFSETTTANSTPTTGKTVASLDSIKPSSAKNKRMPDVDSVV